MSSLGAILEKHPRAGRDSLIAIMQEVQDRDGYLSREAVAGIGRHLGLAASKVYGVATFYNQFRFDAPGRFHIQVCRGTACHVNASAEVLSAIERELGIRAGQTTRDGLFSVEVVACIGACGQAPVISINGQFHARLTSKKVKKVLARYRKEAEGTDGGRD